MRLLACLLAVLLSLPVMAQEQVVNVYNWTDYIDPAVITRFQRETGITVRYDVYDSLETLEGKLLAGRSGYDVIVPTAEPTLARLIKAGAVAKLDKANVPHLAGLDPALMKAVASADPGNAHGAIYLWGTVGLGINPAKIAARLPDAPLDSWDLLLKPENARRLAPCGITLMDSATDTIPTVLKYLGRDPNSEKPDDLAAVEKALMAIRPHIRAFVSGGAVEQLASGETCLAMTYSGDVIQAAVRAKEANRGVAVRYVAPKEGAQLSFDVMAIPADAPNKDAALAFIDFMLRPDVMAAVTNQVRYPNAVPASRANIAPDILTDTNIYPPQDAFGRFFNVSAVSQQAERARTRLWSRFKAGR